MVKDMKAALTESLKNERATVEDRFAKAEEILGGGRKDREPTQEKKPKPKPKAVRPKIIRDSFTLPEDDYMLLGIIKQECMRSGIDTNKSEIVRAGLKILATMNRGELKEAFRRVEKIKAGRPKML